MDRRSQIFHRYGFHNKEKILTVDRDAGTPFFLSDATVNQKIFLSTINNSHFMVTVLEAKLVPRSKSILNELGCHSAISSDGNLVAVGNLWELTVQDISTGEPTKFYKRGRWGEMKDILLTPSKYVVFLLENIDSNYRPECRYFKSGSQTPIHNLSLSQTDSHENDDSMNNLGRDLAYKDKRSVLAIPWFHERWDFNKARQFLFVHRISGREICKSETWTHRICCYLIKEVENSTGLELHLYDRFNYTTDFHSRWQNFVSLNKKILERYMSEVESLHCPVYVDANNRDIFYVRPSGMFAGNDTILIWRLEKRDRSFGNTIPEMPGKSICVGKRDIYECEYQMDTSQVKLIEVVSNNLIYISSIKSESLLGWIVVMFEDGQIRILDALSAQLMFSFKSFHKVDDFQVVLGNESCANVDLVLWSVLAHSILRINQHDLRQCFRENRLVEFESWHLVFSSTPSSVLSFRNSDINFARSVNGNALTLFLFYSSKGKRGNFTYSSFCNLFIPITERSKSILKVQGAKTVDLEAFSTVTIIGTKNLVDFHSAIIIEGVKDNRHFVIKAHLTRNDDVTEIKVEPIRTKEHYEKIKKEYKAMQFKVSPDAGMGLLRNIWEDTRQPWDYHWLTNNCNTWCRPKLEFVRPGNGGFVINRFLTIIVDLPSELNMERSLSFIFFGVGIILMIMSILTFHFIRN